MAEHPEMLIELKGFGVRNKGAELMYLAVASSLAEAGIAAAIAVEPKGDFRARMHHPLLTKLTFVTRGVDVGRAGRMAPASVRNRLGLVLDHEIDAVLDASGFAYGDTWGPELARERLGRHLSRWTKAGKKLVLLPQAFGPFDDPTLADEMRRILDAADLVYARDRESRQHLDSLGSFASVRSAPDFTNLLTAAAPDDFDAARHRYCIIPNAKMIQKRSAADGEVYVEMLVDALRTLAAAQRSPYLLLHEQFADRSLAEELLRRSGLDLPLVDRSDPRELKGIIGTAEAVIASRFHGVVSALSQAVPTISTSWSHKYEMLMEEYGVGENLVAVDPAVLRARLDTFADPDQLAEFRAREADAGVVQRERSREMWAEVIALLRN